MPRVSRWPRAATDPTGDDDRCRRPPPENEQESAVNCDRCSPGTSKPRFVGHRRRSRPTGTASLRIDQEEESLWQPRIRKDRDQRDDRAGPKEICAALHLGPGYTLWICGSRRRKIPHVYSQVICTSGSGRTIYAGHSISLQPQRPVLQGLGSELESSDTEEG